jgi:hypothetical protein
MNKQYTKEAYEIEKNRILRDDKANFLTNYRTKVSKK